MMRATIAFVLCTSVLAGCTSTDDRRVEGLTLDAGDAIAHNTALQVIDPWPVGVQNTNLVVPAERPVPAQTTTGSAGTSIVTGQ